MKFLLLNMDSWRVSLNHGSLVLILIIILVVMSFFQEWCATLNFVCDSLRIGAVSFKALLSQVTIYFAPINMCDEIVILAYGACRSTFHISF